MSETLQQIKELKDSLRLRFDPDKLCKLYDLIDKLYQEKK